MEMEGGRLLVVEMDDSLPSDVSCPDGLPSPAALADLHQRTTVAAAQ